MKTVGLISGGKDSFFNMMHCVANGFEIVALANLFPDNVEEMDSFMYQSVGHDIIPLYAEAMQIPLFRRRMGVSINIAKNYIMTKGITFQLNEGDEVEDLLELLSDVLKEIPDVKYVSVGAILSSYQRTRVENVCNRLDLTCLSYLWMRNQSQLLDEMINSGLYSIIIKVACEGLLEKHLGKYQ
jgi:diphthine-ammonia ligase